MEFTKELLGIADRPYLNGMRRLRHNYYNLVINLLLVYNGIRPAFLFQSVDYQNVDVAWSVLLELIQKFPNAFTLTECDQGMLISDVRNDITELLDIYKQTGSNTVFGHILGYPCSGDIDKASIWVLGIETQDGSEIMANMCRSARHVRLFKRKYREIKRLIKDQLGLNLVLITESIPS